jgi:chitinase
MAEIDRLAAAGISIDGVDMDLESSTNQSAKDQKKYIAMMKQLSVALKARGKKLTAATYAAKFNAPNIHYWPKLARFIDGITPMAYDKSGYQVNCDKMWSHPADWCDYQAQIKQVTPLDKHKFTLGTPGTVNYGESAQQWMGKSNIEHLKGIRTLGAGLAIWDAVLHPSWQTAEVWNIIKDIKTQDTPTR